MGWRLKKEMYRPLNIGVMLHSPTRKLYGFLVELKREAIEAVGVLEGITRVFASNNIPILSLVTNIGKDMVEVMIYVDMTVSTLKPEHLKKELTKIEHVKNVIGIKPLKNGLLVDTIHFPLTLAEERAILLRRPLFEALIKGGYEMFHEPWAIWLYHVGFKMGYDACDSHVKLVGENIEDIVNIGTRMFAIVGFGILEVLEYDMIQHTARVRVRSSFECEMFKDAGKPMGHFIRGFIAGWFSRVSGRELSADEIRCIAMGDPYCEFIVLSRR